MSDRKWIKGVKTVSTFPPEGIFTKDARTIARSLGSRKVSPKGIGSGIRMIQYFINRAGRGLPESQRKELEEAKRILQQRSAREKRKSASPKSRAKGTASASRRSHRKRSSGTRAKS